MYVQRTILRLETNLSTSYWPSGSRRVGFRGAVGLRGMETCCALASVS